MDSFEIKSSKASDETDFGRRGFDDFPRFGKRDPVRFDAPSSSSSSSSADAELLSSWSSPSTWLEGATIIAGFTLLVGFFGLVAHRFLERRRLDHLRLDPRSMREQRAQRMEAMASAASGTATAASTSAAVPKAESPPPPPPRRTLPSRIVTPTTAEGRDGSGRQREEAAAEKHRVAEPGEDAESSGTPQTPRVSGGDPVSNANAAGGTTTKAKTKTKKRKQPPPVQMVCDALSSLDLPSAVSVEDHPAARSWGGAGWWKSPPPSSSSSSSKRGAIVRLRLHPYFDPDREGDWEYLCDRVGACLGLGGAAADDRGDWGPWNDLSIRQAVTCFHQLHRLAREGHSPSCLTAARIDPEGLEAFAGLCRGMQSEMIRRVALLIDAEKDEDDVANEEEEEEDDYDHGLFSDSYTPTPASPTASTAAAPTKALSAWEAFIDLLRRDRVSLGFLRMLEGESPGVSGRIARTLLRRVAVEANDDDDGSTSTSSVLTPLSKHATFFAPVLTRSMVGTELPALLRDDAANAGRAVEDRDVLLTPLARAAAMALNDADGLPDARLLRRLKAVRDFPLVAYRPQPSGIDGCLESVRLSSAAARMCLVALVGAALKHDKEGVFGWIRAIVSRNKSLATMAKSELLDASPTGVLSRSFTLSFLFGFADSFMEVCIRRLMDRRDAVGAAGAFDAAYLLDDASWSSMFRGEHHPVLLSTAASGGGDGGGSGDSSSGDTTTKHSGYSNFFFLATALLRVALHPALKIEAEHHGESQRYFDVLRQYATRPERADGEERQQGSLSERFLAEAGRKLCVYMGWRMQLGDRRFVTNVTDFSLLQLQWALAQCKASANDRILGRIPDWMVKDPARWLARVSRDSPQVLTQRHAEAAIETATELLEAGRTLGFSPIVMTCLLRIATSFVQAGVTQAWKRTARRNAVRNKRRFFGGGGGGGASDQAGLEFDSRDQSIYLSFDKNDLGVTVFTNRLVCTHLCPTLVRTFVTLDVVEGLDMDRETDFSKHSVKIEIADLLVRLWCHPSGECRGSIVSGVESREFRSFAASLSGVLGVYFDDAVQKLSTTIKTVRSNTATWSPSEASFIEAHAEAAAGGFSGARRLFLLLCTFSAEPTIASALGGKGLSPRDEHENDDDDDRAAVRDLANTIVHFLDIVTDPSGGTSADLLLDASDYASAVAPPRMDDAAVPPEGSREGSRRFAEDEIGLDVLVVCHQLLALAGSWHAAAKSETTGDSPLLKALAGHDDVDVARWSGVFDRLVERKNDGYPTREPSSPDAASSATPADPRVKRRRQTSKRDRMTHAEIDNLLEFDSIRRFLDDLSRHLELRDGKLRESAQPGDIEELQRKVLLGGEGGSVPIREEEYGDDLSEHVVSSSAFSSPNVAGKFLHYYDRTTRSRVSNQAGSRHLIKEARKCHRILPKPHAHSSCFVCFAEERMDLCRAIVTGPVGTPYAHGIFVFDIYFPPTYPSVPPLVTFMTTGGGTVRFSPNLYIDGKVCLSLLGLTFAQGESQRWNPEQSSLAQVLLSMQSQIFDVKEPYFNEGSGIPPEQRNTPAGREGSRKHNAVLRLATLRHAVAAHLRSPPLGFEEITRRHFSMCRRRLLVQARRWMIEERGNPSSFRRFERAYGELVRLLVPLADLDGGGRSLPPLEDDAAIVLADDRRFPGIDARTDDDGGEPTALSIDDSATANATAFNPWAGPPSRVESNSSDIAEDDPDDDMYI